VTSVGGNSDVIPESAWNAYSGGFSKYFSRAWYQNTTVQTYLDHHISPKTKQYYSRYTNFTGRGFPDVVAHSL
jgi:tripeptidyl-peptidase-1